MEILRAKTAGFCMGVSLALQKLDSAIEHADGRRICTLGPIIHNPQVLADYEARGVFCAASPAELGPQDCVLIRAHGITRQVEEAVRTSGAHVQDATCPKVKKAQLAIRNATENGATLLLFGEAEELDALPIGPSGNYVLASQTTQDRGVFAAIEQGLREKLERLTVLSTICDATRERQEEALEIARTVDVMVVVGGRQSGNTRRLADLAAQCGKTTYHIEEASELLPENFSKKTRVGLTAGASTPKKLIDAAQAWLEALP